MIKNLPKELNYKRNNITKKKLINKQIKYLMIYNKNYQLMMIYLIKLNKI